MKALSWLSECLVLSVVILAVHSPVEAGDMKLAGAWRESNIVIDGNEDDWAGQQVYLEDLRGAIGTANDSEYLYVAISTQREDLMMKMLMSGFTVWLNGEGAKDRDFGIQYPGVRPFIPAREPESGEHQRPDLVSLLALLDSSDAAPVVLGVEGTVIERLSHSTPGYTSAAMANHEGRLVFELKVPLAYTADHPRALGAEPGAKIAVGMETGKMAMDEDRRKMMMEKMGAPPGGGGRRGGRGGGMGPGRPGGRMSRPEGTERPKPFELWAKVTMAQSRGASSSNDGK